LRRTNQQIEDAMFLDFPVRLAKTLLRLSQRAKASHEGWKVLTQSEIGGMVGLSRASTNRFLRAWQEQGLGRMPTRRHHGAPARGARRARR
jgi:CRP-like cAMP-binding protein